MTPCGYPAVRCHDSQEPQAYQTAFSNQMDIQDDSDIPHQRLSASSNVLKSAPYEIIERSLTCDGDPLAIDRGGHHTAMR